MGALFDAIIAICEAKGNEDVLFLSNMAKSRRKCEIAHSRSPCIPNQPKWLG